MDEVVSREVLDVVGLERLAKNQGPKRLRTDSNRNQLLSDGVGGSHSTLELQRRAFQFELGKFGI